MICHMTYKFRVGVSFEASTFALHAIGGGKCLIYNALRYFYLSIPNNI